MSILQLYLQKIHKGYIKNIAMQDAEKTNPKFRKYIRALSLDQLNSIKVKTDFIN